MLKYLEADMISVNFFNLISLYQLVDPGGLVVKDTPANVRQAGDSGSTPQLGRSPGERNGNPL